MHHEFMKTKGLAMKYKGHILNRYQNEIAYHWNQVFKNQGFNLEVKVVRQFMITQRCLLLYKKELNAWYLSYFVMLKNSTEGEGDPSQSRMEPSPSLLGWWFCTWCSPAHNWPSWLPGHWGFMFNLLWTRTPTCLSAGVIFILSSPSSKV